MTARPPTCRRTRPRSQSIVEARRLGAAAAAGPDTLLGEAEAGRQAVAEHDDNLRAPGVGRRLPACRRARRRDARCGPCEPHAMLRKESAAAAKPRPPGQIVIALALARRLLLEAPRSPTSASGGASTVAAASPPAASQLNRFPASVALALRMPPTPAGPPRGAPPPPAGTQRPLTLRTRGPCIYSTAPGS